MKYGLIEEDKNLQKEKYRTWKRELELQILQLKWDCFSCLREVEQNKLWRQKIEEQINLLCNARALAQPIPTLNLNCSYGKFEGDSGDQNRCDCSLNKTPVRNKETHSIFIFGSNEKTATFEFKFSKEIPNVEFIVFKNTEKDGKVLDKKPHSVKVKGNSCSKKTECKSKQYCDSENVSKDTVNEKGDGGKENKHSNVENKASTPEQTEKVKNNEENETDKKSHGKSQDFKQKISLEIDEVKNTILELKRQIKENYIWRENIEKKIDSIALAPDSCETNKESNSYGFKELKKLIHETYAKLQESVAEIKLSQMSRSELIFRLNDLKEMVFDRIGGPEKSCKIYSSKHENTLPFHDSLQELIVKWNKLEPLLDKLESNGHCKCCDYNTSSLTSPLNFNKNKTNEENISVSEANSCTDFKLKSEDEEYTNNTKDNINIPGITDVGTTFPGVSNEGESEVNEINKEENITESKMSKKALCTEETSAADAETSLQKSCVIRLFPPKTVIFSPNDNKEEFESSNIEIDVENEPLGNTEVSQEIAFTEKMSDPDKTLETEKTDEDKKKTISSTLSRKSSLDDSSFVIV